MAGHAGEGRAGRVLRLGAEPRSAGRARQFVTEVLTDEERPEWVDVAELLVSEMVTNAVLHAHTDIDVVVRVGADHARIEVRDGSRALPTQRSYDAHATTGRGLELVAMLSKLYGVDPLPEGKAVWCVIGGADDDEAAAGAAERAWGFAVDDRPADEALGLPSTTVELKSLPTLLWTAAQQHDDALLREYVLWRSRQAPPAAGGDPGHDPDAASAAAAHALVADAVQAAVAAALAAGAQVVTLPAGHPSPPPAVPASLDVRLAVPIDQRSAFAALQDVLDAADRLAAQDLLLVRPALPEIVALRDWCCDQVVAQLSGVPGTPWAGTAQERFAGDRRPDRALPVWDDALLMSTSRAVVAADDFNRIIGVSVAAAELLGWPVDELVGRRVVAIIPPELREAHVAGFTRHLTTRVAHALGVELDLPVLRRDGTTVLCRFLVETAPASAGRAVYLAHLSVL